MKKKKRINFKALLVLIILISSPASYPLTAGAVTAIPSNWDAIPALPSDTTRYGEDDEEDDVEDKTKQAPTRLNLVRQEDLMKYQLENRYLPVGDTFLRHRWLRNVFIQGGFGFEKLKEVSPDHHLSPLMHGQLGIGKNFNRLNALRLMFHGDFGFLNGTSLFAKGGAQIDHIFDLSSYLSGYNPSRLLNVSSVIGLGGQFSKTGEGYATTFEGHVGVQLRFYTGPKTYLTIEPYVGLGSDHMDLSNRYNWRKIDAFYGATINLVYYLGNNLSPESRMRLINQRHHKNQLSADSLLSSWQQPWFIQFTNGITEMKSPNLSQSKTLGSEMTMSLGKWLSPVAGLRGSIFSRTNRWLQTTSTINDSYYHPDYKIDHYNYTLGARFEGLISPLGFLNNFSWDAPFGFFLAAGAEAGWIRKSQSKTITCHMLGWGGGINIWYQPAPGLKLFAEPRWMYNIYRTNANDAKTLRRYHDQYLTLNLGLTVELRDHDRFYEHSFEDEYINDKLQKWAVGLAGGTHFLQTQREYSTGSRTGWNGLLYGEYHFNRLLSVRLGAEIMQLKRSNISPFIDYNMDIPEAEYAPVRRSGLWDHRYTMLLITPSAQFDLSYLSVGYQKQLFRASAFIGPSFIWNLKYQRELSPLERLKANHTADPVGAKDLKMMMGAHIGIKLSYRVAKRVAVVLVPTVHSIISRTELPGVNFTKLKLMETINLGAQYSF